MPKKRRDLKKDKKKRSELVSAATEKCKSLFDGDETYSELEILLQLKNLEKDIVRTKILKSKYLMTKEDRQKARENRKKTRQHIKKPTGKTGIEQAADKVKAKVEKYKNTKVGKVVKKIHDKAKKGKDTNAYKIYKGGKDTVTSLKQGKFGQAFRTARDTIKGLNKKEKKG